MTGHNVDEVREKLDALREDADHGIEPGNHYTVADACRDFLAHGMHHLWPTAPHASSSGSCRRWILPYFGYMKLKQLTADQVDIWLELMAQELSSASVKKRLSTLRRIIRFDEARNHVGRNVATLVDAPKGQLGQPSKALTLDQAMMLLEASRNQPIRGYIALSVFTGIRA